MKARAIMVGKVAVEDADAFHHRQADYEEKMKVAWGRASGPKERRVARESREELKGERRPFFPRCSVQFLRWAKAPKSERRREALEAAIREQRLPPGTEVQVNGRPVNPHQLTNGEEVLISFAY